MEEKAYERVEREAGDFRLILEFPAESCLTVQGEQELRELLLDELQKYLPGYDR